MKSLGIFFLMGIIASSCGPTPTPPAQQPWYEGDWTGLVVDDAACSDGESGVFEFTPILTIKSTPTGMELTWESTCSPLLNGTESNNVLSFPPSNCPPQYYPQDIPPLTFFDRITSTSFTLSNGWVSMKMTIDAGVGSDGGFLGYCWDSDHADNLAKKQ